MILAQGRQIGQFLFLDLFKVVSSIFRSFFFFRVFYSKTGILFFAWTIYKVVIKCLFESWQQSVLLTKTNLLRHDRRYFLLCLLSLVTFCIARQRGDKSMYMLIGRHAYLRGTYNNCNDNSWWLLFMFFPCSFIS